MKKWLLSGGGLVKALSLVLRTFSASSVRGHRYDLLLLQDRDKSTSAPSDEEFCSATNYSR